MYHPAICTYHATIVGISLFLPIMWGYQTRNDSFREYFRIDFNASDFVGSTGVMEYTPADPTDDRQYVVTDDPFSFANFSLSDWIAGTSYPCTSLEECTYIVNGSDTFGGEDSSLDLTSLKEPCVISKHIQIARNWYGYTAKFRMRARGSKFYYHVVYPEADCCLKMLLYLEPQVESLRYHMSCLQMQSVLDPTSPQVITLSPNSPSSGCKFNVTSTGKRVVDCFSGRILKSDIERNWYIAISSCGSPYGLDFKYSLYIYGWVDTEEDDCPSSDYSFDAASTVHSQQNRRAFVLLYPSIVLAMLTWTQMTI